MTKYEDKNYDISTGDLYEGLTNLCEALPEDKLADVLDFQLLKLMAKGLCETSSVRGDAIVFGPYDTLQAHVTEINAVLKFLSEHPDYPVKRETRRLLELVIESYTKALCCLVDGYEADDFCASYQFWTLETLIRLKHDHNYILDQERLNLYGETDKELKKALCDLDKKVLQ